MKRGKAAILQLFVSMLIFSVCLFFVLNIESSFAWLHREQSFNGSYKIGKIDLWLNGVSDATTPIMLTPNAPTRFFTTDPNRDENFDVAVSSCLLYGLNKGDIDVLVDLSIEDNNQSNYSIYYILVDSSTADQNFLNKKYRDYLDSLFSAYNTSTPSNCKNAMNSINNAVLDANKGKLSLKDDETPLFYMLIWSEYDNIASITSEQYISVSYPISIKTYSYQQTQ